MAPFIGLSSPAGGSARSPLRILIADDHALMLRGLEQILKKHYDVVGSSSDGRSLVEAARRLRPDIVVVDIAMPELNGFEAAKQIRESLPKVKVLFLSAFCNATYLRKALQLGASGYVLKAGKTEELLEAIREISRGRTYWSPGFGPEILRNLSGPQPREEKLTDRQREILQLIVEGRLNKEIAHRLSISIKTVDFHRARMMTRLGARSTAELVRIAIELGLVTGGA